MNTQRKIVKNTAKMFARYGYEGVSMRKLAHECDIAPSVIYHYYKDKDELLKAMFDFLARDLGIKRGKLPDTKSAADMLLQRILFQIDHAEEVVAVLKYFLHYRSDFQKLPSGYVPDTAYLHIKEVLERGVKNGEFIDLKIDPEAKVITHAINGFLLEYYPHAPTEDERDLLAQSIHSFILRSIQNR